MASIGAQIDLEKYPLDQPGSDDWNALVAQCRRDLDDKGMFELPRFLTDSALHQTLSRVWRRGALRSCANPRAGKAYISTSGFTSPRRFTSAAH